MSKERIPDILASIEEGLSARKACLKHGVPQSTWNEWLGADEELAVQYARAKEAGLEVMAEEIQDIADRPAVKYATQNGEQVDSGDVALRRLQVDARKWLLSKMLPKKYGEKIEVDNKGEVKHTINFKRG
jgi:hypothetical protein